VIDDLSIPEERVTKPSKPWYGDEDRVMKTNWPRLLITFVAVYVLMQVCNVLLHGLWLAPTYASLADVWPTRNRRYGSFS
jgi:hypothetical protein